MNAANALTEPFDLPPAPETIPVFARSVGSWRISVGRQPIGAPELSGLYDEAAPSWTRTLDRLGFPDAYETMFRRLLSGSPLAVEEGVRPRVLDCGVGTGALSLALGRAAAGPFDLDGLDISVGMLAAADANLRAAGLNAALGQADIRSLPYADDAFDLVMTSHVLEHLADPAAALTEMTRVLKPGGLLVACLTRRSALGMLVHLKWRTHRVTPDQAQAWLRERGLGDVGCHFFDHRVFCRRLSLACVGRKPR